MVAITGRPRHRCRDPPRRPPVGPHEGRPPRRPRDARATMPAHRDAQNPRLPCTGWPTISGPTGTRSPVTILPEPWSTSPPRTRSPRSCLGSSRRSRWEEMTKGSVVQRVLRFASDSGVDVHVIARRDVDDVPGSRTL